MPFTSGAHVACTSVVTRAGASLTGEIVSSDTFPSGSGSSTPIPQDGLMTEVAAAVDIWAAWGKAPGDPSQAATPRTVIRAGETRNLFLNAGAYVRVVAVP